MEKKRMDWMDGIKLLACVGVFISHFQGFFYEQCGVKQLSEGFGNVIQSSFNILKNGNLWVCLFCVISGYFASKKEIKTGKELLKAILKRYLRFFFPLLCVNIIAFVLYHLQCFQTQHYAEVLQNDWIGGYYGFNITPWIVLRASIKMTSELNSPLWMLFAMFVGTCFIYVCKYALSKCKVKYVNVAVVILWIILLFFFPSKHDVYLYSIITAVGAFLKVLMDKQFLAKQKQVVYVCIIVVVYLCSSLIQETLLVSIGNSHEYIFQYLRAIYSVFFIIAVSNLDGLKKVLECKVLKCVNNLSFGIYLLHWLVLSSVSLAVYGGLIKKFSADIVYCVNFLVSLVVVFLVSKLFHITIEKWIGKMEKFVITCIKNVKMIK